MSSLEPFGSPVNVNYSFLQLQACIFTFIIAVSHCIVHV